MNQSSSGKTQFTLYQGAILGGLNVILLIILYKANSLFNSGWSSLSWLVYFGFVPWSTIRLRDKFLGGYISYGSSFGYGVKISLLSGIIIGFFYYLILKVFDPGLVKTLVVEMEEAYLSMGLSEKMVEEMSSAIDLIVNPWFLMFTGIFGSLIYGIIVPLITSFFTMRKGDPFQEAMKSVN